MWNQRSRVLWMSQGDRNTKYFHSKATKRHRRNSIRGIRDTQNQWQEVPESIASVLINFYQELFLSSNLSLANGVLDRIPHLISADMNQELSKEFLACEVQIALSQMAPLKAPGPDGMPPLFYQHFWVWLMMM